MRFKLDIQFFAKKLKPFLRSIASAIRTSRGTTASIPASMFATEIGNINPGTPMIAKMIQEQTSTFEYIDYPCRITYIGSSALEYCDFLSNVSFPVCSRIYENGLRSCFSLVTATFPKCSYIGSYAFASCSALANISFPIALSIYSYAFASCSALSQITFPKASLVGSYAFTACKSLTYASFGNCRRISDRAFNSCTSLSMLNLTGNVVTSLMSVTAFSNTGITSTAGTIYVKASLLNSFKSATNWVYFSTRFVSLV